MVQLRYPEGVKPNPAFWANPATWWASRRKLFRRDNSNAWRKSYLGLSLAHHPDRSVPFSEVLNGGTLPARGFRFLVLGDTGEGDRSQYALVPLIRALKPQLVILNGDVAYPAGNAEDFLRGFFRPYRDLGIPLWAIPGNHEYYARDKGRTFFQVFCTYHYAGWWQEYGIPLVPQPGTYWELKERTNGPPLAVIAVDSGMAGDLDGAHRAHEEDRAQHAWLRSRLRACEEEGKIAIVLFHIPSLVNERHEGKVRLLNLHRILAASSAVRLVICGHIHNYQYYTPETFGAYLQDKLAVTTSAAKAFPHYVVSGGGGAYLSKPSFDPQGHQATIFYPSLQNWNDFAGKAESIVAKVGGARSAIGRIAGRFNASLRADADAARYLSLVMVDVDAVSVRVRHILMDDLEQLFSHLPPNSVVRVDDLNPPVGAVAVRDIIEKLKPIDLL